MSSADRKRPQAILPARAGVSKPLPDRQQRDAEQADPEALVVVDDFSEPRVITSAEIEVIETYLGPAIDEILSACKMENSD